MQVTLADNVRSYLEDDEVALRPDDHDSEARANTWTYGVAESGPLQAPAVIAALLEVAEGLRVRLRDSQAPGWFYAWYDDQAGQLRCSLTSLELLPFGVPLRLTDPAEVVRRALNDATPGLIERSRLHDVPPDVDESLDQVLAVWAVQVS